MAYALFAIGWLKRNLYLQLDTHLMGIKDDDINPIQDTTNHHIQYEEKSNNDKTV